MQAQASRAQGSLFYKKVDGERSLYIERGNDVENKALLEYPIFSKKKKKKHYYQYEEKPDWKRSEITLPLGVDLLHENHLRTASFAQK